MKSETVDHVSPSFWPPSTFSPTSDTDQQLHYDSNTTSKSLRLGTVIKCLGEKEHSGQEHSKNILPVQLLNQVSANVGTDEESTNPDIDLSSALMQGERIVDV